MQSQTQSSTPGSVNSRLLSLATEIPGDGNLKGIGLTLLAGGSPGQEGGFAERGKHSQFPERRNIDSMIELPSQNRERRFSDRNSERGAETERIVRGKKNKGRKRRGERAIPPPEIANQIVHINQFELRSVSGPWHNTLLYLSLQ